MATTKDLFSYPGDTRSTTPFASTLHPLGRVELGRWYFAEADGVDAGPEGELLGREMGDRFFNRRPSLQNDSHAGITSPRKDHGDYLHLSYNFHGIEC